MAKKMKDRSTFGPAVSHEKDGSFLALCTWCFFRSPGGTTCTHVSPPGDLTGSNDQTPEWCEMRDDMIADAKQMAADAKQP